ncbi:hypothetical protein BGZ65_009047 [Modicella reniformis]|uniref:Uncharacterized protein n=1 Tax=Modicella reniformis TaxID=1440133 RepID=A0A9P6M231_9FUNG|nr:hypothetical protein BGZ65_009047 [Modicella reniformis]
MSTNQRTWVQRLANDCAKVTTPKSILDIVQNWRPPKREYALGLGRILVDFIARTKAKRQQPQMMQNALEIRPDIPDLGVQQTPSDCTKTASDPSPITTEEVREEARTSLPQQERSQPPLPSTGQHQQQQEQQEQQGEQGEQDRERLKRSRSREHMARPKSKLIFKVKAPQDFAAHK